MSIPEEVTAGPELLVVESGAVGMRASAAAPEVTRAAGKNGSAVVAMGAHLVLRTSGQAPLALLRLTIVPLPTAGNGTPPA
jgi:hypothetical protein